MAAFMDLYPSTEEGFVAHYGPRDIFATSDAKFTRLFRFDKATFKYIVDSIRHDIERPSLRPNSLSCVIQVAAAIRYYATGSFQTDIGEGLRISQPSVHRSIANVGAALNAKYDEFIMWPNREILVENKIKFYDIANFPNVIGCIDGTHVRIMRPRIDQQQYINRKFYPSLNLQCVCGPTGLLHNVEVNWPGATHDSFILRQSNVYSHMESSVPHGFVLGDSAYPLRPWLLTPFANPSNPPQISYNSAHKKTRVIIEHTFGRLKRRFHLLHSENRHRNVEDVVRDIRACCVLHNIAIKTNQPDIFESISENQPTTAPYEGVSNGRETRDMVVNNYFS